MSDGTREIAELADREWRAMTPLKRLALAAALDPLCEADLEAYAQSIREAAAEAAEKKLRELDTDVAMCLCIPKERLVEITEAILESRTSGETGKDGDT
jgi:hypothetical protein